MDLDPEPEPNSTTALIIVLVVLTILSAFFSSTETAFSSVNKARLKVKAQDGSKRAKMALSLADEKYDKLLFTVLIGNNIVNLASATIATIVFAMFIKNESLSATVSTLVMTVIVLIFGEITPKTIAKERPESFAMAFCPIMYFLMIVFTPFNLVFSGYKKLLRKIFKFKEEEGITEEELLTIVEEANEDGTLDKTETELISSAIEFNDAEVGDILVPRVDVVAIAKDMPMDEIKKIFLENAYSRMPVYSSSIDSVIGMLHEKDFFGAIERGKTDIKELIKPISIASEHMKVSTLLSQMKSQKIHMAVVLDEYGGTLGIVTMEDILEELVGEIWDEHDEVVDYFTKVDEENYLVDGRAELDDFMELFALKDDDEEFDSQTVSGWVIEQMGIIPRANSVFDYKHLTVTVKRSNPRRVLEISVKINPIKEEEQEE